ncbi:acyl carrier protein [bacterium]|nr:acyl carrier protein [bacterium]
MITREEILARIIKVSEFELGLKPIAEIAATEQKSVEDLHVSDDLGADSLDKVELLLALDKEFEVDTQPHEHELKDINTIGGLADFYLKKIAP